MKKNLTFKEVEEIIFSHPIIQLNLNKYKSFFDSYHMAKMNPSLKRLAIRSVFGFMEAVTSNEEKLISSILGYEISINKMSIDNIKNISGTIDDIELNLEDCYNFTEMCVYRKDKEVKILCWR